MKKPDDYMSNSEFSLLVGRICMILGAAIFVFIICASERELTWNLEIPLIIFMSFLCIFGIFTLIVDYKKDKNENIAYEEEENIEEAEKPSEETQKNK